jgi:hypothetical protein
MPDSRALITALASSKTMSKVQPLETLALALYVRYYVETCPVCALSKNENKKPAGLHQPFKVPEKNWQVVSLDYVTGLPKTERGNECMWYIIFSKYLFFFILIIYFFSFSFSCSNPSM